MILQTLLWMKIPHQWNIKRNESIQRNLISQKETFYLEILFLIYIIIESSTVILDHIFLTDPDRRFVFALFNSVTFDLITLIIFPSFLLYRNKRTNLLWQIGFERGRKENVVSIRSFTESIEPRREFIGQLILIFTFIS